MSRSPIDDCQFERLLSIINQATSDHDTKLNYVFTSTGIFTGLQASRLIYAQPTPTDKLKCLEILESKFCRMTCSEARDVLNCFSIPSDRLKALGIVKRYLMDCENIDGVELILQSFQYEKDKMRALQILRTVRSDVAKLTPAGGHQGYAALGSLYTQSRPLELHAYGDLDNQRQYMPGGGSILLPAHAQREESVTYNGNPSYAYPRTRDYATDRGYPGNEFAESFLFKKSNDDNCPARPILSNEYSTGGISMSGVHGGPAPVGFPNDESREMSNVICH